MTTVGSKIRRVSRVRRYLRGQRTFRPVCTMADTRVFRRVWTVIRIITVVMHVVSECIHFSRQPSG